MICGALQTLNEEACEDVLEETEETRITIEPDNVPQTSIIPPSPDSNQGESPPIARKRSTTERKRVSYDDSLNTKINEAASNKSSKSNIDIGGLKIE